MRTSQTRVKRPLLRWFGVSGTNARALSWEGGTTASCTMNSIVPVDTGRYILCPVQYYQLL